MKLLALQSPLLFSLNRRPFKPVARNSFSFLPWKIPLQGATLGENPTPESPLIPFCPKTLSSGCCAWLTCRARGRLSAAVLLARSPFRRRPAGPVPLIEFHHIVPPLPLSKSQSREYMGRLDLFFIVIKSTLIGGPVRPRLLSPSFVH